MNHSQSTNSELSEPFDVEEESKSSSSSSDSSDSCSSTSTSDDDGDDSQLDALELAKITNDVLRLPRGLCENVTVFSEFFSLETWCIIPEELQAQLQVHLPRFSHLLDPNDALREHQRTISMLFNGDLQRFGHTPLSDLQRNLEEGNCRPDVLQLRKSIAKSRRRELRFQKCERLSQLAKQMFVSRENLLSCARKSAPDAPLRPDGKLRRQQMSLLYADTKLCAVRARKRFFMEVDQIVQQLDFKSEKFSADEEDEDDGGIVDAARAEQLQLETKTLNNSADDANALAPSKTTNTPIDKCIYGTFFERRQDISDEETVRFEQQFKQRRLCNRNFREYLLEHKRRKLTEPNIPDFETFDIRLRDVCARAQMGGNFKRIFATGKTPGRKPKAKMNEPPALVPIQQPFKQQSESKKIQTDRYQQGLATMEPSNLHKGAEAGRYSPDVFAHELNRAQQQNLEQLTEVTFRHEENDQFHSIIDGGEVELQQEEVETYGTCEETIPTFLIANEVGLPHTVQQVARNEKLPQNVFQTQNKDNTNLSMQDLCNHMTMENIPKLEPISSAASHKLNKDKPKTITAFNVASQVIATTATPTLPNSGSNIATLTPIRKQLSLSSSSSHIGSSSKPTTASNSFTASTELIQETHACFFSLIRDFFCATPNHRMKFDDLKEKIDVWLCNPITALNDWYSQAESWSSLLTSAINFLAGDIIDQPDEYVPYIEYKSQLNIFQWIGAGRDSDTRLSTLCEYWMQHRNEFSSDSKAIESQREQSLAPLLRRRSTEIEEAVSNYDNGGGGISAPPPPQPRCPTTWTVRAATANEVNEFQRQERERFENPHRAYTYRMHGYESVVGPVKGIYSQILALTKARGHSMMIGDRPNFVTILTLVRDATARLPNGEGTRADISELLKCSQYINRDAAENVLQTIVSGALDRMHTEHDPCVRYDPKRKIWIYLHRNRTEDEFERMHQQYQGLGKNKKPPNRKQKSKTLNKLGQSASGDVDATMTGVLSESVVSTSPIVTTPTGSVSAANTFTLPALVPANPLIVSANNQSMVNQKHQQFHNYQQPQPMKQSPLPKSLPVPPLKYNIPNQQQKSLLKTTLQAQRQQQEHKQSSPSLSDITDNATRLNSNQRMVQMRTSTSINSNHNNTIAVSAKQFSFSMPQAKSATPTGANSTTPIIVATPAGLQTVHVSNATAVTGPSSSSSSAAAASQLQAMQLQSATVGGKKVALNKPIIINQITTTQHPSASKTKPSQISTKQQQQQHSASVATNTQQQQVQHSFIIPISMAATVTTSSNDNNQAHTRSTTATTHHSIPTIFMDNSQLIANDVKSSQQQQLQQQQQQQTQPKNIIRLVPATMGGSGGGGGIVKSSTMVTSLQQQQQQQNIKQPVQIIGQRVIANTTVRPQHILPQKSIGGGISLISSGGNAPGAKNSGAIVKMSPQAFAQLQQKHGQHILVKQAVASQQQQPQQRVVVGNTAIVGQPTQSINKNIVVQHMPTKSATSNNSSTASSVGSQTSTGGLNISSTPTTNRIQTINASNLTPQQQRVLLQNLKQQQQQIQFKTVQVVANTQQQQQQVEHSQQGQQALRNQSITVVPQRTAAAMQTSQQQQQPHQGKTVAVVVSQPQGLTRILKTTTNAQQQQLQQQQLQHIATSNESTGGTRVLTSSTGQIISLESLLQKQGGALKITGAKSGHTTNLIQLASNATQGGGSVASTQYAVVSQGRNIVSLGTPHRLITTQAGNTAVLTSSVTHVSTASAVSKGNAGTARFITTTAGTTTRVLGKATTGGGAGGTATTNSGTAVTSAGNIRVINATGTPTSFNIANIQGKQVVFATTKPTQGGSNIKNVATISASQAQQLQNAGVVIGGQTVKIQGNTNLQQLSKNIGGVDGGAGGGIMTTQHQQSTTQMQTVIMGNQILRLQQIPQPEKKNSTQQQQRVVVSPASSGGGGAIPANAIVNTSAGTIVVNSNEAILNSNNSNVGGPKTLVLGSTGTAIRLQPTTTQQTQVHHKTGKNIVLGTTQQQSSAVKSSPTSRVVLAVQGGGQIFLSPSFHQGSSVNLKSLQSMKVVSVAQTSPTTSKDGHQQQLQMQQQQQQEKTTTHKLNTQQQQSILKSSSSGNSGAG